MKNNIGTLLSLFALPFAGWFTQLAAARIMGVIDMQWGLISIPLWIAIVLVMVSMLSAKVHRLVIKAYMGPLAATFCIVLFILMMNFVWRYIDELTGKGLDFWTISELVVCATANMVPLGLPLALLLSSIMALGNLGENYELLAMKSAGMSLMRILKPLMVVVGLISVFSFYLTNNIVPYANQRMYDIMFDIREQRQELKFQDGMFFNGLPDMSIRVGHQDEATQRLNDVLIFDTRSSNGDMTTTVAESGFIRMSEDKSFLYVTLFNGRTYEHTRSSQWYDKNSMRMHEFSRQDGTFPIDKVGKPSGDMSREFTESRTRNMSGLEELMDSLQLQIETYNVQSLTPLVKRQIFMRDTTIFPDDSLHIDRSEFKAFNFYDSIANLSIRDRAKVYQAAFTAARSAQGSYSFDEQSSKIPLTQYYLSLNEWHRKLTLPVSILIFFMIGAPLGAIIRKGGLGLPAVISVIFFVIFYVISIWGEKMAKEGTWDALYGMWLPIPIFMLVAIYLTIKAKNDSSLLDTDWYDVRIRRMAKRIKSLFKHSKKNK
jgi:lipopolysaccharide export system permease protein